MSKMMNVPVDTVTGKDLDYISDMFQWNSIAYKKVCNDMEYVNDQNINDILSEAATLFDNNLNLILEIVNNPGGDFNE